jgi:hypothetical protein
MKYAREQALQRIREFLVANTRDEETTCQVAARLGIFCRGFDQWDAQQLRALYPWLAKRMPADTPKEEFLKLVVAWDNARALVHKATTTCDALAIDHDACLGFDRFSNEELKGTFPQIFQAEDQITQW